MPNHVTTIMTFTGSKEVLDEFESAHIGCGVDSYDNEPFKFLDFRTLIPMPAALDVGNVPVGNPTTQMQSNKDKYGYESWYDWSVDMWGTKWNSYSCDISREDDTTLVVKYETAWSLPTPIIAEITELYPELNWELETVEEGGYFSGQMTYIDGVFEDNINGDEDQWREYAENMLGYEFDDEEDDDTIDGVRFDDNGDIVGETEPSGALPAPETIQ